MLTPSCNRSALAGTPGDTWFRPYNRHCVSRSGRYRVCSHSSLMPASMSAPRRIRRCSVARFMELTQASVPAVRSLLARTQDRHADLLHVAQELLSLDRRLQKETGQSLDSLYPAQPPVLAGLVEMLYDLNHHARFRILEELAYEAGWSNQASQEISLIRMRDETRNFFLNTPLLEDDARLTLPVPFKDPRIDLLSQARIRGTPFAELAAACNVPEQLQSRFRSYFTDQPPRRKDAEFRGDDVRVRYFGHACVLIETDEVAILMIRL